MLKRPCSRCGVPSRLNPCANCRKISKPQRSRPKLPRQARGYDAVYERNRADMIEEAWRRGYPCVICGGGFERKRDITAEHVIKRKYGGSNARENLAPAHSRCNSRGGGLARRRR